MNCPNCNSQIGDSVKFCPFCGTKIEAQPPAEETVKLNDNNAYEAWEDETVQEYTQQEADFASEQYTSGAQEAHDEFVKKSKSKKKYVLIGAAAIAAIAVIIVLIIVLIGGKGKSEEKAVPTLYATKNELYVIKSVGKKGESILISNDYAGSYLLSENYEYIVYSEDYNKNKGTRDIYLKKLMDDKSEPVLVAKDADYINRVIGNVDSIFYTKGSAIYVADNEGNSEKLTKDADFESVSEDGRTLYYSTSKEVEGEYDEYYDDYSTNTLYTISKMNVSSKESTELVKDAERTEWNKDFTKLYTLNNGKLNCIDTASGKSSSIADKAESMSVIENTLYYSTAAKEYDYTAFVADTYAEADSKLSEPEWNDYAPDWDDYAPDFDAYDDYDAYWDAYDAADAKYRADYDKAEVAYEAAYDAYYEAEDRIYIRDELKNDFSNYKSYTIYKYDGSNSTALLENASEPYISRIYDIAENVESYTACPDKIAAKQYKTTLDSFEKIDITSVKSAYDLREMIDESAAKTNVIISGTTVIPIETGEDEYLESISFNSASSEFYFTIDKHEETIGELYSLPASAKSFSEAKKIASDVYTYANVNGTFTYFDDLNEDSYECTANYGKEKINDVMPKFMTAEGINGILYFSDYDDNDATASLYWYANGESKLITDDISTSLTVIEGKYIVVKNYDYEHGGDLVCIDGKESYDIDSRVVNIYSSNVTYHNSDGNTTYYYE